MATNHEVFQLEKIWIEKKIFEMKLSNCGWKQNYGHVICVVLINVMIFYPICGWMLEFGIPLITFYIITLALYKKWKKKTWWIQMLSYPALKTWRRKSFTLDWTLWSRRLVNWLFSNSLFYFILFLRKCKDCEIWWFYVHSSFGPQNTFWLYSCTFSSKFWQLHPH